MKKTLAALLATLLLMFAAGPMHRANAAAIKKFDIFTQKPYLIAGVNYYWYVDSDKASTTSIFADIDFSPNNGATWHYLPDSNPFDISDSFILPIDPQITSVLVRANAKFVPLIGSNTFSQKILGPYLVLQPGEPTNVTATANDNGTVTIAWNDNSNMETNYIITRFGPDGTKNFTAGSTTDHIGPLTFVDTTTNTSKETVYLYRLTTVIDKYELPEQLQPGVFNTAVKTKVPIKISDIVTDTVKWPVIAPITNKSPLVNLDSKQWEMYVDFDKIGAGSFNDKLAVQGVTLTAATAELKVSESIGLVAAVAPATAANKNVTWRSDNPNIATVDSSGLVKGIAPGTATITVKTEERGLTAVCVVTVREAPAAAPVFKDIGAHWAKDDIAKALSYGIVQPNDVFRPDADITRAEFTVMLMRALKPAVAAEPLVFKDKDKIKSWAQQAVQQAVKLGIVNGTGSFRPEDNITHAETMLMVVRASGLAVDNAAATTYADDKLIPKWAKPAVAAAQQKGIVFGGIKDGKFAPSAKSTRAEAASAIVRMLGAKANG